MDGVQTNAMSQADRLESGILSVASEEVSLATAEELTYQHFGIGGTASRLTSERDQNFKIASDDGREYALRITNHAEDPSVNDLQVSALQHIEQVDPLIPVPRVFPALNGQSHLRLPFEEGRLRAVRLLSYLPGMPLNTVERTPRHRTELGSHLAKLDLALKDFSHHAAGHVLAWDIQHASSVRPLVDGIADPERRELVGSFLASFEARAKPVLPTLRAQVIHNDLNFYNVLVDPNEKERLVGILDFGDMVFSPLVVDVAVGASYHMNTADDPWDAVAEFVSTYNAVSPLERREVDLLYDLIAARFVVTVAITGWRAERHPENSTYILKNNAAAWRGLAHLSTLSRDIAQRRLRMACNME
ncbi:aminoglycoside phosphotransferase [Caballeronia pedi]|uniref:Hydroxylysine kinase n=1 Tax=Caballeronia pedi TaxID=1777141 RepID=A0A157ZRN6_9BURK|nr:phosphotransferase [Caballeronia pedi]SAK48173.1 aminoglycoside phosphotransferase [Caballeronia pedi]